MSGLPVWKKCMISQGHMSDSRTYVMFCLTPQWRARISHSISPVAELGSGQLAEKCFLLCPEYCQFPNKARPQGRPHKSVALATPVARPGAGVGTPEANRKTEHHANVGRELKAQADRPKRPSRTSLQARRQCSKVLKHYFV